MLHAHSAQSYSFKNKAAKILRNIVSIMSQCSGVHTISKHISFAVYAAQRRFLFIYRVELMVDRADAPLLYSLAYAGK